ncbi:hypothetical protein [Aestuariivirga litoralis]|uniref:hypothetical protein n=1 Tax=Aestuariivirga litoralis TaxID=2650924 RepID=UPI0018C6BE98|nr:hypothetical protein [Aestuariivirga litoralis]MBG1231094.1 hypothetical protein [Aestuariivirga litoralis]
MPRALKIILAFVGALIVGEALPIIWYIIETNYLGVFDRDGGGAMGSIFILGPLCAIICAMIATLVVISKTKKPKA